METPQQDNLFLLFTLIPFSILLIWWIRRGDLKEIKRLEEQGLEMNSTTKMRSWRVYIVCGGILIATLIAIIKRLFFN